VLAEPLFFSVTGYSSEAGANGPATNLATGGAAGNAADGDNNNTYGRGGGRGNSTTANTGSAGQNGRVVIIPSPALDAGTVSVSAPGYTPATITTPDDYIVVCAGTTVTFYQKWWSWLC
jgi:hypothetical protein